MALMLIGCGYWGRNWVKTLFALGELGAVCEPSQVIRNNLSLQYPGVSLYTDLSDALAHPGIEGAIVATPVITHQQLAERCLRQGKGVLVEKPLALDPKDAQALVNLAEEQQRVLAVGHLLLYHPALIELKRMISQGALGEILSIQCTRVNLGKVRNEESAWWSLAPHDLSILCMLLDGQPLTVTAASAMPMLGRVCVEDAAYVALRSASGVSVSVQVSWLSPVKKHETIIIGSRKMVIFEDTRPAAEKLQVLDYDLSWDTDTVSDIRRGESRFVTYPQSDDDLLTLQAKAFLRAIRGEQSKLPNNGQNGYQVIKLLSQGQQLLEKSTCIHAP